MSSSRPSFSFASFISTGKVTADEVVAIAMTDIGNIFLRSFTMLVRQTTARNDENFGIKIAGMGDE
ncbi:MAG: DUF1116 domain-containing protein [Atopobiaceae bacterium]|nr:DUF1116 domain-containing protein [Atopobiaceae bacterium]